MAKKRSDRTQSASSSAANEQFEEVARVRRETSNDADRSKIEAVPKVDEIDGQSYLEHRAPLKG